MDVSHTDVLHQRFDGWIWLLPDHKTISIHSRGVQQPLTFYSQGDEEAAGTGDHSRHEVHGDRVHSQAAAKRHGPHDGAPDTGAVAFGDSQATK